MYITFIRIHTLLKMNKVCTMSDVIIGFSFGKCRKTSFPVGTNSGLAWSVAALLRQFKKYKKPKPILCLQQEIADAFVNHGFGKLNEVDHVIMSSRTNGKYVNTNMVFREAVRLVKNMHNVIVVAHPDHAPRCMRIVYEHGCIPIRTQYLQPLGGGIPWIRFGCDRRGYYKDSRQPWTRTRRQFLHHETGLHTCKYSKCSHLL